MMVLVVVMMMIYENSKKGPMVKSSYVTLAFLKCCANATGTLSMPSWSV